MRVGRGTLSFAMPSDDAESTIDFEPYVVKSGVSLAANLREAFKTADLMRASKKFKTADATNEVLKRLTEMGYLRKETPENKKSGRPPAPKYHVNPIWLESFKESA